MTNYTMKRVPEPTHENALVSGTPKLFRALSGDSVLIRATTLDEAEQKYWAFLDGKKCPCGYNICACVQEDECRTIVTKI